MQHLADEIVKSGKIDAAYRNSGIGNLQQFSPEAFFGGVQTDDYDRMGLHQ
jgi:hypothetical protein